MAFNETYNFDDVFVRNIIVGVLDFLNRKVQYRQTSDSGTNLLSVPYFFEMGSDERFFQDFYINYGHDCDGPVYAEGNYEPVPRGILSLSSISINSAALTNKFVRGTYNKTVKTDSGGTEIKAYSAFLSVVPISMTFGIKVICNTTLESMKIIQETISTFYRAGKFQVDFNGFRVESQIGFSNEYGVDKPVEISYPEPRRIEINYTIEVESYLPIPDGPSERFRGNVMDHGIGNSYGTMPGLPGVYAKFSADVDNTIREDREAINPEPDYRGPYGYGPDGQPQTPENSI